MRSLIILALFVANGCSKSNDRICGSLAAELPGMAPKNADEQMQVTAWCVERWAARLAAAPDDAAQVAEAALGACDGAIVALEEAKQKEQPGSEMTLPQASSYWRKRAHFIVIQTRAGNCYQNA